MDSHLMPRLYWTDELDLEFVVLNYHVDIYVGIAAGVAYVCLVWVPAIWSIARLSCKQYEFTHEGMNKEWRRLYRQYNYLEIMFRTHVIVFICLIIMDLFESGEPHWTSVIRIGLLVGAAIILIILWLSTRVVKKKILKIKEELSYDTIFKSRKFRHLRQNTLNKTIFKAFYRNVHITNKELINPLLEDRPSLTEGDGSIADEKKGEAARNREIEARKKRGTIGRIIFRGSRTSMAPPMEPLHYYGGRTSRAESASMTHFEQWTHDKQKGGGAALGAVAEHGGAHGAAHGGNGAVATKIKYDDGTSDKLGKAGKPQYAPPAHQASPMEPVMPTKPIPNKHKNFKPYKKQAEPQTNEDGTKYFELKGKED